MGDTTIDVNPIIYNGYTVYKNTPHKLFTMLYVYPKNDTLDFLIRIKIKDDTFEKLSFSCNKNQLEYDNMFDIQSNLTNGPMRIVFCSEDSQIMGFKDDLFMFLSLRLDSYEKIHNLRH